MHNVTMVAMMPINASVPITIPAISPAVKLLAVRSHDHIFNTQYQLYLLHVMPTTPLRQVE